MDERQIKRLAAMVVMAVVAIMIAKYMLTRTVTALGQARLEKKHAAAVQQAAVQQTPVAASAPDGVLPELQASAVPETADAASSVAPADSPSRP